MTAVVVPSALLEVSVVDESVVVVSATVDSGGEELATVVWDGDVAMGAAEAVSTGFPTTPALLFMSSVLFNVELEVVAWVEVGGDVVPAGEVVS